MSIWYKGKNKGAYGGKSLKCPFSPCDSTKQRFVENVTAYRLRYRCGKCLRTYQYDISNSTTHPYAAFNKPFYQRIVERAKMIGGFK